MAGNFLLEALAPDDLERLRPHLQPVSTRFGDVIYRPDDEVTHV